LISNEDAMYRIPLDSAAWTVRAVGDLSAVPAALRGREVVARVPGCVHTDLIRAGLIPDPLVGMNEREVQWIGETDWEYRAAFEVDAALLKQERVDLVCEGLDTIAEVRVNGVLVGRAANMFHPHRFDVRGAVRAGANELSITFRSPLKHIRAEEERLGKRPVNGDWEPYIDIRKAACSFGWDWAPKLAGCGVWKSIGLEAWTRVRLASVIPVTQRLDDHRWRVRVDVELQYAAPAGSQGLEASAWIAAPARFRLSDVRREPRPQPLSGTGRDGGGETVVIELDVLDPTLWQVRPVGPQGCYQLSVVVHDSRDQGSPRRAIATAHRPLGFREVRLKTPKDADGTAFTFEVNGREVFCKGANWVPEGPWPGQVSRETYRERLGQAAGANMNMLRVWGGGFYEDDEFYEICDELGIMVWQDFMFACAMYPEEQPLKSQIRTEARHQIARLSSHPSVVLWCGGNECIWAHDAWGNAPGETAWEQRLQGRSWGGNYYHEILPALLSDVDPLSADRQDGDRAYWPNSPYPGSPSLPPNSADHGDRHTWDKRGDGYREVVPRFCSEFGQQSPSNYATLLGAVGEAGLKVGSEALEHRQRATGGTARHIDEAIAEVFRQPRDFDEWHYLAQLTQARAMKTGIEWMRVNRPRCMGALVWQFNECWAGMSWSLVDAGGREKLAYHAVREAFRERLITIQPFEGRPWLWVANDDQRPSRYVVDARRMSFDGIVLAALQLETGAAPWSVSRVCDLQGELGEPRDPAREFIVADTPGHRASWFFMPDRDLQYPRAQIVTDTMGSSSKRGFRLTARSFVRDLVVAHDRLGDFEHVSGDLGPKLLLPGERLHVGIISRSQSNAADDLLSHPGPPEVWCANQFGAGT
jgi:beta-mannosidase